MAGSNFENFNSPVMVGAVPLFGVSKLVLTEGYDKVAIAGSSIAQLVRPKTKKIEITASLPGPFRALRPVLEAMALVPRGLAVPAALATKFTGVPVVAKSLVAADMQITTLVFTQDNEKLETLTVQITLEHVPRSRITELVAAGLDLGVAVASPLLISFVPEFAAI